MVPLNRFNLYFNNIGFDNFILADTTSALTAVSATEKWIQNGRLLPERTPLCSKSRQSI
jgi:hypothetical protein